MNGRPAKDYLSGLWDEYKDGEEMKSLPVDDLLKECEKGMEALTSTRAAAKGWTVPCTLADKISVISPIVEKLQELLKQVSEYAEHMKGVATQAAQHTTSLKKTWRSGRGNMKIAMEKLGVPKGVARQAAHSMQYFVIPAANIGIKSHEYAVEFSISSEDPKTAYDHVSLFTATDNSKKTPCHDNLIKHWQQDEGEINKLLRSSTNSCRTWRRSTASTPCRARRVSLGRKTGRTGSG